MSKNPLISIILTTKNEEGNITLFLQSVKKQTYPKIELIVIDNNSTDKTASLARKFTKYVYDFGPERSAQRNYGAKKSKGEYLVFLDADMELSRGVISDCVKVVQKTGIKALTIPEKTVGNSFMAKIRKFEREMYEGDPNFEIPRFFERHLFFEYGGYDKRLTGPEDYDLPYRISRKNKTGRTTQYLYHHEEGLTLSKQLKKKYYYAKRGAFYAAKHPELVWVQGTILFRKAYLKHWRNFIANPVIGASFLVVRFLETIWAVSGYISSVGIIVFFKTLFNSIGK